MDRFIFILEDDADRRARFEKIATAIGCTVQFWHDAGEMIAALVRGPAHCAAFSLDCDLIPPDGSDAWGDRIEVARYLAGRPPIAPVIVHSTNRDGSRQMMTLLRDAGWHVRRVAPIGGDWIERDWRMEAEAITGAAD